ncbi:V-type proton ATPase subunit G 1 [Tupaia chinensis]|uniref:V-type proton ATPase subunit G 1 n=1 Tax=Tupaia chinensis TaxID=246437 RepID=L9KIL1_TUPCH|nr:V-type proton ATPase subunit G 1 [Tupaia chinensis]
MVSQSQRIQQLLQAKKKATKKREKEFKAKEATALGSHGSCSTEVEKETQEKMTNLQNYLLQNRDEVLDNLLTLVSNIQPEIHENYCTNEYKKNEVPVPWIGILDALMEYETLQSSTPTALGPSYQRRHTSTAPGTVSTPQYRPPVWPRYSYPPGRSRQCTPYNTRYPCSISQASDPPGPQSDRGGRRFRQQRPEPGPCGSGAHRRRALSSSLTAAAAGRAPAGPGEALPTRPGPPPLGGASDTNADSDADAFL